MQNTSINSQTVFNFQDIYTLRTIADANGEYWFVASDICKGLEIADAAQAVRQIQKQLDDANIPDTFSKRISLKVDNQHREMTCVNEAGVNLLVMQSRKKEAMPYKWWIASEVLPSIRKTGRYEHPYTVQPTDTLTIEQGDTLRDMLKDTVAKLPKEKQATFMIKGWAKLRSHFKVGYRQIPQSEYPEALSIVSRHVVEALEGELLPPVEEVPAHIASLTFDLRHSADYLVKVEQGNIRHCRLIYAPQ